MKTNEGIFERDRTCRLRYRDRQLGLLEYYKKAWCQQSYEAAIPQNDGAWRMAMETYDPCLIAVAQYFADSEELAFSEVWARSSRSLASSVCILCFGCL